MGRAEVNCKKVKVSMLFKPGDKVGWCDHYANETQALGKVLLFETQGPGFIRVGLKFPNKRPTILLLYPDELVLCSRKMELV